MGFEVEENLGNENKVLRETIKDILEDLQAVTVLLSHKMDTEATELASRILLEHKDYMG